MRFNFTSSYKKEDKQKIKTWEEIKKGKRQVPEKAATTNAHCHQTTQTGGRKEMGHSAVADQDRNHPKNNTSIQ
eukprot:512744-Ditylum_brightwellii.AAC.1